MSNNKQSSVEWLVKKLADLTFSHIAGFLTTEEYDTQSNKVIEQAKTLHKEESIKLYNDYQDYLDYEFKNQCGGQSVIKTFEQYYNATFGGNNEPTE